MREQSVNHMLNQDLSQTDIKLIPLSSNVAQLQLYLNHNYSSTRARPAKSMQRLSPPAKQSKRFDHSLLHPKLNDIVRIEHDVASESYNDYFKQRSMLSMPQMSVDSQIRRNHVPVYQRTNKGPILPNMPVHTEQSRVNRIHILKGLIK